MKKVEAFEPWIFLFFGAFHLHRVWGLLDRESYARFWVDMMENQGWFYFLLMGVLAGLCVLGIIAFFKNRHQNAWWRWIYVMGGSYVLFDLCAILTKWELWHQLILRMYDTEAAYWNLLWFFFILMGGAAFALGINLLVDRLKKQAPDCLSQMDN